MSEQKQIRLGEENSILSHTKVRGLTPDDLGISSPEEPSEQLTESERAKELRATAAEAASNGVGAAVLTVDNMVFTGSPVEGNGWGVHAVELAISKAISDGADALSDIAVYSDDGQSGLCGRCLQAIADSRTDEVTIQIVDADDGVAGFDFDELYRAPWLK